MPDEAPWADRLGRKAWRLLGAALVIVFVGLRPSVAQESEDASLLAIREEVERLRAELGGFDERESGILARLERLSLERLLREEEIRGLGLERRRTERQAGAARRRAAQLRDRLEEQKAYLASALRQAYKLGRLREYRLMLEIRSPEDFGRAFRYISDWSHADADRIAAFRRTHAELASEEATLAARLEELDRIGAAQGLRREELERNRGSHREALRQVEDERDAGRQAVKELEEAAGRLEALLASLPEGDRQPIDGRLVDLSRLRGHLPWPAEGKVLVPYGDIRHPRFQTLTPHPGIDLEVAEGTPVHPIFGGRVAYSAWFRGYGNTVIVDHGGDTLSVYAHLRAPAVEVGQRVDPAVSLGPSGSTGSLRGPTLYLEIRHRGRTVDPAKWLRPLP